MLPLPALLLIIATLLPLASFVVLMFIGKRLGRPLAGVVGVAAIGGSFVCSMVAMVLWLMGSGQAAEPWGAEVRPINVPLKWIPVSGGFLDLGVYVDSLTIAMFAMITLVSTLIFIFSIGYMAEDKRFARFFTYLSLFCFSMLGLVLGGTILHLFIFWELVGLCSYFLIGFWYEKKSASNAAIKAFVTNRVGDFGFLIGLGILFYHVGNVTLPTLWSTLGTAGNGHEITLQGGTIFSAGMLTAMGIGLFFGAVGKSAQFPLHVWLPDAMEGPTPVSALIHAATMVAAGVYLVGRIFPILTPDAKLFIAVIGCVTLTMAALIAIAQSDIKKVLAYSTLSQLGYMILAMGIGSWVGGLFHLITHAFFKALLFLGSGSVIHAMHHEQDMSQYGGLMRKTPWTAATFGIAVLAIAGVGFGHWGFAGFYSKDLILANAASYGFVSGRWLFFIVPSVIALVTSFYMMRCWMLTFWGKPRNQHLYDHAHESPILFLPLVVLAILAIAGGRFLGVKELLVWSQKETKNYIEQVVAPGSKFTAFSRESWPADAPEHKPAAEGDHAPAAAETQHMHPAVGKGWDKVHAWIPFAFIIGLGGGFVLYMHGYRIANVLMAIAPLRWIHTWLRRRMFFDELYEMTIIGPTRDILSRVSGWFDKYVVDGLVNLSALLVRRSSDGAGWHDRRIVDGAVNGAAWLAQGLGRAVRTPQTGRIRLYVMILMAAVTLGVVAVVTVVTMK